MRLVRSLVLAALLVSLTGQAHAQQPPKASSPAAAQDGFVPVDSPTTPQDSMPAPRLVAIAYAVVWMALFGYLWSVRSRLARVEREMETVSRRAAGGGRSA